MKVRCPKNPDHKVFSTVAHVMQSWKVDGEGEFIGVLEDCLEVTHPPDSGNVWYCLECADEAIVEAIVE